MTFYALEQNYYHGVMLISADNVYDVLEKPYQPCYLSFPAHRFGKDNLVHRSFQLVWFNHFQWIHYVYDVPHDALYLIIKKYMLKKEALRQIKLGTIVLLQIYDHAHMC